MSPISSAIEHRTRSEEMGRDARQLHESGIEWATVAYFYSAYHLVRAALLNDPIFDDMARLKRVNPHLQPSDRDTTKHKGRRNGPIEFGINDLILMLYGREASGPYNYLHIASVQVRYEASLRYPLDDIQKKYAEFRAAESKGSLTCTAA